MILGITGTIGAGKGTVVDYLVSRKGFTHYSVREFLMEEIAERGLVPDRTSTRLVGNDLREKYGPACIIQMLYQKAERAGGNAIIESVRTVGEAEFLKGHGALLVAVDADRMVRYERIHKRGLSTDHISFETFIEQEDREMVSTESFDMNISAVMKMADHTILNNGTPEELYAKLQTIL